MTPETLTAITDPEADIDDLVSRCPAVGVWGIHSNAYFDELGIGQCQWCGETVSHQKLMDAYLAPYASDRHYKMLRGNAPEFLAVLATAEYHEHWSKRA